MFGGQGKQHQYFQPDTAKGGDGGFSLDGQNPSGSMDTGIIGFIPVYTFSSPTLSGGAVRNTNITVYNLASESSKLRQGRSDTFTLIDS